MKHFKKPDGSIHAFEPDYDGPYITSDMVACEKPVPLPPTPPTPLQQIRALEQQHMDDQRKLNRQTTLIVYLDDACSAPDMAGKTRDEVHAILYAANRGYRALYDLEQEVVELRKLMV